MYRVDILTDFGLYTAVISVSEIADALDVNKYLSDPERKDQCAKETALNLARIAVNQHLALYGWTPLDNPAEVKPTVFSIESGAVVQHIKAYIYTDNMVADTQTNADNSADRTPTREPGGRILYWEDDYLGQKIEFHAAHYVRSDGTRLVLPYFVNGKPAILQMKASALTQKMAAMMDELCICQGDYEIVIPDVPLTEKEALEYLEDYAREAPTRIAGGGKAKAWPGWGASAPGKEG